MKKFTLIQTIVVDEYYEVEAENGAQAAVLLINQEPRKPFDTQLVEATDQGYHGIIEIHSDKGVVKTTNPECMELILDEETKYFEEKAGMTQEALQEIIEELNNNEMLCPVCSKGVVHHHQYIIEGNLFSIQPDMTVDVDGNRSSESTESDWLECSDCGNRWPDAEKYVKSIFFKRHQKAEMEKK